MELAGVPQELIGWTARRGEQIAACLSELESEYVTAVDDDAELKFLPVVSERARTKFEPHAARKTRPAKPRARPLAQPRARRSASAILRFGVELLDSLLERARAAAAAIRARVVAVVDIALASVDVTAMVFLMNGGGRFHHRHLLAEARRHLALVLRGRGRERGLDEQIVDAALATHCADISEPKTLRGRMREYRLYTARWAMPGLEPARRSPAVVPDADRHPPADPGAPAAHRPPEQGSGEREIPRVALRYDRAVLASKVVQEKLRATMAVRGRAYDAAAHQQAAMPEQLLGHDQDAGADSVPGRPERAPGSAVDLAALRALMASRTDVESLGLTAERLPRLQDYFTEAADKSRVAMERYAGREEVPAPHPVREDGQGAHRRSRPDRTKGGKPAAERTAVRTEDAPVRCAGAGRCAPVRRRIETVRARPHRGARTTAPESALRRAYWCVPVPERASPAASARCSSRIASRVPVTF
jgi:hypothetical protein